MDNIKSRILDNMQYGSGYATLFFHTVVKAPPRPLYILLNFSNL